MDRMTFGKYKGRLIADVIESDPRYALWAHENVPFFKLTAPQIQDCVFRSDVPPFFPRSPHEDDQDDDGTDSYAGMSYSDFGNN